MRSADFLNTVLSELGMPATSDDRVELSFEEGLDLCLVCRGQFRILLDAELACLPEQPEDARALLAQRLAIAGPRLGVDRAGLALDVSGKVLRLVQEIPLERLTWVEARSELLGYLDELGRWHRSSAISHARTPLAAVHPQAVFP